jgi:hypothetical protein
MKTQEARARPRTCAYRFCGKPLPAPVRKSGQPRQFCDNNICRKSEWRLRQRDAEIQRAEAERRHREAMWAKLRPLTRRCLSRVLISCGPEVAHQLAEAIIAEIEQAARKTLP